MKSTLTHTHIEIFRICNYKIHKDWSSEPVIVAEATALWCFHILYAKAGDDKAVRKEETMIELNRVVYDDLKVSSPNPNNK